MSGWSRYLVPSDVHRGLGLVCLGVGAQHGNLSEVQGRTLDCEALVLVRAGGGELDGAVVESPALLSLPKGRPHTYGPGARGWAEEWVLFDGSAVDAYRQLGYLAPGVTPVADPAAVSRAMTGVRRALDDPDPDARAAAAVHGLVLMSAPVDGHPSLVAIASDAVQGVALTATARRLGMTPEELRATVKELTGCSPKELAMRHRIARAQERLTDTDETVAAIARSVGVPDAGYFSRQFSRRVGMSPSDFRRQHRRR